MAEDKWARSQGHGFEPSSLEWYFLMKNEQNILKLIFDSVLLMPSADQTNFDEAHQASIGQWINSWRNHGNPL